MQISAAALFGFLLVAQPVLATIELGRLCPGSAIQCYFPNGRCAKWCPTIGCKCADNKNSLGGSLKRSKCITDLQWLGRKKC
ncbi:hypothetical protein C8034_v007941 [Colletotrichum sidae]|uniref:Uncharacterized protein n=1 Tax=Colletotrichum sidae TaxID=1347389 RepID=A0A4R8T4Q7_9PEZI|nr:hypothetical protein C8034_v007941 [Colletotrichum sidae]